MDTIMENLREELMSKDSEFRELARERRNQVNQKS